jgi:hypothetical protein
MERELSPQEKGGLARTESLSAAERKAIAQKAAAARWDAEVPEATHEGSFNIGTAEIAAAVLPNGKRLLTQSTFLLTIGRARTPKAGTGVMSTVDGVPFFLQADVLKPFLTEDLLASTTPIFFRTKSGKKSVGYEAELLPKVANVYLKFRDQCLESGAKVPKQYAHIVTACDLVVRGLAEVGIVALVDEATGYQEVRDRIALQKILDQFLRKEFAAWASQFPTDFYRQIFRLRNWSWKGMKVNRPQCVASYTKDLVYARLAPGILKELEARNPMQANGRRKSPIYWWLTEDVGHPALAQHLHAVVGMMKAADTWDQLMRMMNRAFPVRGDSIQMDLFDDLD